MHAVSVGLGLAWRWALLYAVLSFLTQLWAGNAYSQGQGGGLAELIKWSVIFGLIAIAVTVERAINGNRVLVGGAVFLAAVVGQTIGTGVALYWFTTKGGPVTGDWWIGPAFAALAVTLWVHLLAPRASTQDSAV